MDSWLKGLVLSIAVMLGLAEPASPPSLSMRVFRDERALYASLELDAQASADLERLINATFTVRLKAFAWAGNDTVEAYRDIRFDGRRYSVNISETGGLHGAADLRTAWLIASRFALLPLGETAGYRYPLAIGAKVSLELPDDPSHDAMVVWGYRPAAAYLELDAPGMAPYY